MMMMVGVHSGGMIKYFFMRKIVRYDRDVCLLTPR
jgi:hypothetical protein